MTTRILASTALIWALAPHHAIAQEATASGAGEQVGIAEIVVTAQRKAENLQDVGVPIDAVTSSGLTSQGVTSATDLGRAVPAISINNGGGQVTSIFLRGVGNITNNAYFDAAISPSYDGVVLGRPSGAFGAAFYDLERVEVLKGPQGILYGRNATGGAINIIPHHPEIGVRKAGFELSYGNYDAISAQAYLNMPITENSALRLSAIRQRHDGYNRDGSDDQDRYALRGQYLVEATDRFSVRLAGDYTKIDGVGSGDSYLGNIRSNQLIPAPLDNREGLNTPAANAYRQTLLGPPGFGFLDPMNTQQNLDYTYWGVNAEMKLDTGIGEFTLIPAYRKTTGSSLFYGPGFNTANFNEKYDQFTTELRLSGKRGMFDYVLGGFYFDENIRGNNNFNQEFVLPLQDYKAGTQSWATFGQLTANITSRFRLIGGLRYTHDRKTMDGVQTTFVALCGGSPPLTPPASFAAGCAGYQANGQSNLPHFPNFLQPRDTYDWLVASGYIPGSIPYTDGLQVFPVISYTPTNGASRSIILKSVQSVDDQRTFSKVTWRAATEFEITDKNLLYASVETGYRAGGLQIGGGRSDYEPEYITAYTIGSKNRFFNNQLQVNLEAFYWKYKNQQITYFSYSATSGTVANTNENVGRSTIKGFDIDTTFKPFSRTTLSAKVQYLDTKYQDLILQTLAPRDNYNCPRTVTDIMTPTGPVIQFDCSGRPLLQSPKWTINLGAEQVVPLSDGLELVGSVYSAWKDKYWTNFNYLDFMLAPAYWSTSANLTLQDSGGRWSIGAFVNNIEGDRRLVQASASPIGFATGTYSPPRTYGLRLRADF